MLTKNEIAEKLTAKGIALPANWGKLSTARAQAFLDIAETTKTEDKPSLMGTIGKAIGGAVKAVIGGPKEPVHYGQTKAATMPKNPNWKRRQPGSARGWYPSAPGPLPEVLTRQLRRQMERREQKMPIGASQELWHKTMGFGKLGKGKRRAVAVA